MTVGLFVGSPAINRDAMKFSMKVSVKISSSMK